MAQAQTLSQQLMRWLDRNISDRSGLGNEWDSIDGDVKRELVDKWEAKFDEMFRAAERATLERVLPTLRREHYVSDADCWYSCPKSGKCCDEKRDKTKCDCGADEHNAKIDSALAQEGQG